MNKNKLTTLIVMVVTAVSTVAILHLIDFPQIDLDNRADDKIFNADILEAFTPVNNHLLMHPYNLSVGDRIIDESIREVVDIIDTDKDNDKKVFVLRSLEDGGRSYMNVPKNCDVEVKVFTKLKIDSLIRTENKSYSAID